MIRIVKSGNAPAILRKRGLNKTIADCDDYDSAPTDYNNGNKKFKFESTIYGAKSVKKALKKAQYDKCCFCESKVTHIAYGDVEHFRPKAGYRQNHDDPLGRPGYYWLAYEWKNLFYSCEICNQKYKKNVFPLRDPAQRALCHHDDIAQEEPLFIHPAIEDPEDYISFREEYPFPIDNNLAGRLAITELGLDREDLNERRRDRLAMLKALRTIANLVPAIPESAEARSKIEMSLLASAEYAAMARAMIDRP